MPENDQRFTELYTRIHSTLEIYKGLVGNDNLLLVSAMPVLLRIYDSIYPGVPFDEILLNQAINKAWLEIYGWG